ncbi:MAG TPA: Flp family type IVb pilin [Actinomycetes bacterium]
MPGSSLRLARLRRREEGITAVEYALMVAVVAVLLVVGFYFLFTNISDKFSNTGNCIANSPTADGTCAPAGGGGGGG